jgi:hypothetical protein
MNPQNVDASRRYEAAQRDACIDLRTQYIGE